MRIGILGLEKLIEVQRSTGTAILIPRINVFIDFARKSADYHAFHETANKIINEALDEKITALEELCAGIIKKLLEKYTHATRAEIDMEAEYVVVRITPASGQKTQEMYKILARAISEDGKIRKMVGTEVTGMTSCPCAQEGLLEYSKKMLGKKFSKEEVATILETVPLASHNQRNVSKLLVEVPESYSVDVDELIQILENSMSSKIYEVLKREDEVSVVLKSHANPNFVEDIVRKILVSVVHRYKNLPDESIVFVRSESFESIHQHNAIAERISSLRELRREVFGLRFSL